MMRVSVFLQLYGNFNFNFTDVHSVEIKNELNYYRAKCYRIDNSIFSEFSFILHEGKYIKHGLVCVYYTHGSLEETMHFKYGMLHNEEGPAFSRWYPDGVLIVKDYYIDGKLHREDGPAKYFCYIDGPTTIILNSWFHHGKQYKPLLTKKAVSI